MIALGQHSAILQQWRAVGRWLDFEEILQQWRAVGNTVFDLTGPKFETQISRSRNERVTARPTGRPVKNV